MALSGTLTGTCTANTGASSRYDYKIEWSATQNVNANTSTITATAYVRSNNSNYSTSTNWTSVINGTTVKTFNYHVQASAGWVNFGSKTWTVNHNADGTCTTSITGSFSGTYNADYILRSGKVSGNITLNTIPRASSFTLSASSVTLGDKVTVNISRASSSFTHKVLYKLGTFSTTLGSGVATSLAFTRPVSDSNQITTATSGTATVTVETYNGSTKVGTASKTLTVKVPSSVVPSCDISLTGNSLLSNYYVAGKSTVTVKITNASGVHGSTIKSYSISGAGISSTATSATSKTLSAGTQTLTVKVTDSRGRSYSKSQNITVHSYATPTLSASVFRSNSDGVAQDDGTYVSAKIKAVITNIANANVNAKKFKVEWKRSSASAWSTLTDWATIDSYEKTWTQNLGGGWDAATSYDVQISTQDSYGTVSVIGKVSTISCVLNIEEAGVGVGKVHENGALDIGGEVHTNNHIYTTGQLRFKGDPNGKARVGYDADTSDAFFSNAGGNFLRLKADKTMTYAGNKVYTAYEKPTPAEIGALANSGTQTISNGGLMVDQSVYVGGYTDSTFRALFIKRLNTNDNVGVGVKFGATSSGSTRAAVIEVGYDNNGAYTLDNRFVFFSNCFRPNNNGSTSLGASSHKWSAVYSSNGSLQTSDERYKVKRGLANLDDCYEMVKNTDVFNYIMLNQDKNTLSKNRLGKMAMENEAEDVNVHMGIMAQDILDYECGRQVLTEGEVELPDGTVDTMYHINPYAFSSALMGALKVEINKREALEKRVDDLEKLLTAFLNKEKDEIGEDW